MSSYNPLVAGEGNILIADESALFMLLHSDLGQLVESAGAIGNPLLACASSTECLSAFNVRNPLYGPPPIKLLVSKPGDRRANDAIAARYTGANLPSKSFVELRDGLFLASPELVFFRMASFVSVYQLAKIGTDLCARYYIDLRAETICTRVKLLTTLGRLDAFVDSIGSARGAAKARTALRWVLPNSGSPEETNMQLLLRLPLSRGGFNLPFSKMNYAVLPGRLSGLANQASYSIDLANPHLKIGVEYDGAAYHLDQSADKRRRNDLKALGWDIFPIDKSVLYDARATVNVADQLAKRMGVRLRKQSSWEGKYLRLRSDLGLSW
ncbi:MAG: hypothetical protein IJ111_09320 [Eggerthellaceae bacterium]|nr:hypothetical protein [Eggerthellaceae bacterium]